MKTRWLDRRIACAGPHLALCLSEEELREACRHLKVAAPKFVNNAWSDATTHFFEKDGAETVVVCLAGYEERDPVEVAGLLVHEAVHIWQSYAERIGERNPGAEQEAYAIQAIAQELMAEFARRQTEGK